MCSDNQILVQAHGVRPENILLMVHEVIEGLIADFFTGIVYEYRVPCPHCLDAVCIIVYLRCVQSSFFFHTLIFFQFSPTIYIYIFIHQNEQTENK